MRRKIIYEPTLSDTALLVLRVLRGAFVESFWPHPYYHTFCKHKPRQSFRNALNRLEKRGLIIGERIRGKAKYFLSEEGEKFANRLRIKLELAKSRRWDGRWRILIFDIPEKMRGKRDLLRKELVDFGFYPLQKSVWAYPYPLPADFFDLWDDISFGKQLILVEAWRIKYDEEIRAFFGLI